MAEKILVVDDDLDTLRLVGLMLERQGYAIVAASTGQQALSLAKSEKPDLIVLDLMMPDIDGIQVARQLRANPETQNIFIIMFTARGQMEDKLEGFDAGADDYLTKPVQPRELIAHIKAVLKRAGVTHTVPAKEYKAKGNLVGVLAAKGGVGVSTVAVNLGVALRIASKKPTIVADFRPGSGTIGLELGYSNAQGVSRLLSLSTAAINPEAVESELNQHASGLHLLLSSPNPQDARDYCVSEGFDAISRSLAYLANYIVLDLGSSLTPAIQKVIDQCQIIVFILEPVPQSLAQSRALFDYLVEHGSDENSILLTLVNRQRAGMQLSLGQVQDQFSRNIPVVITAVPELAYQSQVSNTPMVLRQTDGVTAQQFASLANKVLQRTR
jgi:CheY-like chemotaxis protein